MSAHSVQDYALFQAGLVDEVRACGGHELLEDGEVAVPFFTLDSAHIHLKAEIGDVMRPSGRFGEFHPDLLVGFAPFFEVAFPAAGYEVIPRGGATLPSRDDVIEGEIFPAAAVLAGVVVPGEDAVPGESELGHRAAHVVAHFDDAGGGEDAFGRSDFAFPVVDDVGLAAHDEREGAAEVGDVQGFVVCVEEEDFRHFSSSSGKETARRS